MPARETDARGVLPANSRRRLRATLRGLARAVLLAFLIAHARPAGAETFKPFALKTLDGQPRSLSDVQGKVTLVVFFFPSCVYCNTSLPVLQKLYDEYRGRGLAMVWINIVPEQEAKIPAWQEKFGYQGPVLVGATQKSLQKDYGLTMTPAHFLLGPQRKVLYKHFGYKAGDEKKLEVQIQKALEVASSSASG